MSWTHVMANWPHLITQLRVDFSRLDAAALRNCRGEQTLIAQCLADAHDLTPNEAREALEDWLTYTAKHAPDQAAA